MSTSVHGGNGNGNDQKSNPTEPVNPGEGDDEITRLRSHPKMTAKGKAEFVKTLKNSINTMSKRLKRQIEVVLTPLLDSSMMDAVNNETSNLDRSYMEITESHARLCEALDSEEDAEEYKSAISVLETIDQLYFGTKEKICAWQLRLDQENRSKKDGSVHSSSSGSSKRSKKSSKSRSSSGSSNSNKSVKLQAKIAGLKAEAEAIKRTNEAELAATLLRKDQEIKKIEAMEKVYAQSTHQNEIDKKELPHEINRDNKHHDNKINPTIQNTNVQSDSQLQLAVMDIMRLQCAPKPNLDTFSGDPLDYWYFRASFREVVEAAVPDQHGRLTRLIQYTSGEAKDLVKHLVHASKNSCYDQAIKLLDKEFGNPHLISYSYIKELRQWEVVKQHDAAAFKKLYRFLLKCEAYKSSEYLAELDSVDMIRTIICKLHTTYQERWNRKAADSRRKDKKEPGFAELLKYLEAESNLLSDPAYSREAMADVGKQIKSFSTGIKGTPEDMSKKVKFTETCPLCQSQHDLEECETYLSQSIDERHKTVFQQRLCFSCLAPVSEEHVGVSCTNKKKCVVCGEDHPTTLHGGKSKKNNLASMECTVISMCVVPVQLWHKPKQDELDESAKSSSRRVTVYALLDDCSQGTFIKEDILESLNIKGLPEPKPVGVKTLNGSTVQGSIKVDGLFVEAVPSHSVHHKTSQVQLPTAYSREFLAVDPEEIPTPSKISCWDHLEKLVQKIPDYDPSIPIGLMIGGDCPKAIEPVEVIPSDNGGPYAKRTSLGWCIIGPIKSCSSSQFKHSNLAKVRGAIPVKDVSTGMVSSHVFAPKSTVQDHKSDQITNMLNEMYLSDFNESASEKFGMSVEDQRFLEMMDEGVTKKNGHYQLPLPFRNKNVHLPDNKRQALSRLRSLKRKLLVDGDYKAAYDKFVQALLSNGHARIADVSKDVKGKVWHVPHFGVFNAKKGKLRMVYDFSVQFHERCLNDELIQGPNLANTMLGVIIRFRKEEIAYMADIESMFYQVMVPEEQRCFLRFLYWPDGQLDADPVEYEMCVCTLLALYHQGVVQILP